MALPAWVLTLSVLAQQASSLKLWNTPADLPPNIPAGCRAGLTTDIKCAPRLVRTSELTSLGSLDEALLTQYCNSTCTDSLKGFADTINTRCGSKVYDWGFGISRSGNDIAKPLQWAQTVSCLTDKTTNEFCIPLLANGTAKQCSDCSLKYLASFVNNDYAPEVIEENAFSELLSSCSVKPTQYPITTVTGGAGPTPTSVPARRCLGTNYTVKATDTCESIAGSHSVAVDRFLTENGIDFKCQSMRSGDTVCIGLPCKLHKIQNNETCSDLLRDNKFSMTEFLGWNPVIHSDCKNMAQLEGRNICISPPGEDTYKGKPEVTWSDTWTTPSGQWTPAPTIGKDAPNNTAPAIVTVMPTATGKGNNSDVEKWSEYVKWCPVTDEVIDEGFEWELLSEECSSILDPYCSPFLSGPTPTSTTFPSSCMPSVVLGLE